MSFPSVQSANQKFHLEYRDMPIGVIHARRVRTPQVHSPKIPELFRIDIQATGRDLRECFTDAVVRYMNGSSRQLREDLLFTREKVAADSVEIVSHLNAGVLFLYNPTVGRPVRIHYIPEAAITNRPYSAPPRRLDSFLPKLGIISSIT